VLCEMLWGLRANHGVARTYGTRSLLEEQLEASWGPAGHLSGTRHLPS